MKSIVTLIIGVLLGALSWGMAHALSGKFEPFDSGVGFLITQVILSSAALLVGFKKGTMASVVFVAGGYIGLNAYAYAWGNSEARAWAWLGAVTIIALVVFPALAGLTGGIARYALRKFRQRKEKKQPEISQGANATHPPPAES